MSTITFSIDNLRDEESLAPLLHKYPRQTEVQGAFVEIDEEGCVSADYNAEIGNAVPVAVYHNRTARIRVSPYVSGRALADYLEGEGRKVLERIHSGHSTVWDGSNTVGRYESDAQDALQELEAALEELPVVDSYTAEGWIENDSIDNCWPEAKTIEEAVASIEADARAQGVVLVGDIEKALRDKAEAKGRLLHHEGENDEVFTRARLADGRLFWQRATLAEDGSPDRLLGLVDDEGEEVAAGNAEWIVLPSKRPAFLG